jgi:hypothetical protein
MYILVSDIHIPKAMVIHIFQILPVIIPVYKHRKAHRETEENASSSITSHYQ